MSHPGFQAIWPPRGGDLISVWPCASLRINTEHSPGSRCSGNPTDVRPRGCWPRVVTGVMDLFSARWDDLQVDGRPCSYLNISHHPSSSQWESNPRPPEDVNYLLETTTSRRALARLRAAKPCLYACVYWPSLPLAGRRYTYTVCTYYAQGGR